MKAGFLQYKPLFGRVDHNLDRIEALIESTDADLLVLPELFNTGYVFTSKAEVAELAEEFPGGRTVKRLTEIARRKRMHIVAGIAERYAGRLFNSAALVTPAGFGGTYRKIHLFSEEKRWFDPGDLPFEVYEIGSCRIGMMVCFDWFFPESMRVLSLKGAEIVCHPANLVLPFCQDAMVTRCLENRVFAITANRTGTEDRGGGHSLRFTGKSQITAPDGSILHRAAEEAECIEVVEIDPARARDKRLNPFNDLFGDRRPEFYGEIGRLSSTRRPSREQAPEPSPTSRSDTDPTQTPRSHC
ncbi:MAG: (R)-stereoselective amidase [Syntrophaceae bacterium PtaU1.Bin231]|nr:MAG: (R)-stereoselective amidase [Syntrophaceae bacterium PtaU1.Bin231]